jgi:hypothetical protein
VLIELAKLMMGLTLAALHRPVADFVLEQDRLLTALARRGGVNLPTGFSAETSRTIFFLLGILIALAQMARIYLLYLQR